MNDDGKKKIPTSRLEAILSNAVDAIITIDDQGIIDSVNPATEKMFGFSAEEMIGINIKMLMPNPYHDEHDGYLQNYRQTKIPRIIGIGREVIGRRKNNSTFPMHLAVSEILVDGKQMFTGIVRDISELKDAQQKLAKINAELEDRIKFGMDELKKTQDELVQSEKFSTLGKVSGGIAHEIRNPLNAVKMSVYYLLHAQNPSEDKVREHLERIDRQVTVIDNVVTALSDVARLPEANLVPVDLAALLETAVNAISLPPEISVQFQFPNDLPLALVDENQISIAIKNLVRNARDAMPNGGCLTIAGERTDAGIALSITDEGTGIQPENIPSIFEPLFTTKARGMGLGLSITKAIVEKNQGTVSVENNPGKGSCFRVSLKCSSP